MATQRLSNVLSHITPGKTPLEQMYASQTPLHNFPQIVSITVFGRQKQECLADSILSTAPLRTPTMLLSHSPPGHP
jgi:hypothetical protein